MESSSKDAANGDSVQRCSEARSKQTVIQAVRSGIEQVRNANANLSHLLRESVVSDFNKSFLPIVGDDSN